MEINETNDDLNIPKALVWFWDLVKAEEIAADERWGALLEMDRVLGLGIASLAPEELDPTFKAEVDALVEEREAARRRKDFTEAET